MDIREMIAGVEIYIHIRTNQNIRINLEQFNDPRNLMKLQIAYSHAAAYFNENNLQQV